MNYKLIIFDLDGTLLDTSEGIINSYNATAEEFYYPKHEKREFRKIIGGRLPDNLIRYFGFNESNVREAVTFYRKEYESNGVYQASHYPGMLELLENLKQKGYKLAVATLKREDFAKIILQKFCLIEYFDKVFGMDENDSKSKSSLIDDCLIFFNIKNTEAVLVGDSITDFYGAQKSRVDFIAVTYGWGFTKEELDLTNDNVIYIDSAPDLLEYL